MAPCCSDTEQWSGRGVCGMGIRGTFVGCVKRLGGLLGPFPLSLQCSGSGHHRVSICVVLPPSVRELDRPERVQQRGALAYEAMLAAEATGMLGAMGMAGMGGSPRAPQTSRFDRRSPFFGRRLSAVYRSSGGGRRSSCVVCRSSFLVGLRRVSSRVVGRRRRVSSGLVGRRRASSVIIRRLAVGGWRRAQSGSVGPRMGSAGVVGLLRASSVVCQVSGVVGGRRGSSGVVGLSRASSGLVWRRRTL